MAAVMEERAFGDVVLKADEVTVTFGAVKALTGVSFEVREREILAIIGPNGAGKTTMLNVINGFYHPDSCAISFKGQTRRRMRPHVAAAAAVPGGGVRPHCAGDADRAGDVRVQGRGRRHGPRRLPAGRRPLGCVVDCGAADARVAHAARRR